LNAIPEYVTTIDGVDIQFAWIRSRNPKALPMIMTHGWPGSIFELFGVIGPLTDPTTHGGRDDDAFDLVLPSLPGHGFSSKPKEPWNAERVARAWVELMRRLGYKHYVAQGGGRGAAVVHAMARQAPGELLAIHVNLPATVRRDIRPQTLGYSLDDSPVGLAAFIYDQIVESGGELARDEILDDIMLYWLTQTASSAARLCWEEDDAGDIAMPGAVTVFARDQGGRFAAWQEPALFSAELRAAFRSQRRAEP
jgi:pimeloyl-ACP methyl ester carboxylesterase